MFGYTLKNVLLQRLKCLVRKEPFFLMWAEGGLIWADFAGSIWLQGHMANRGKFDAQISCFGASTRSCATEVGYIWGFFPPMEGIWQVFKPGSIDSRGFLEAWCGWISLVPLGCRATKSLKHFTFLLHLWYDWTEESGDWSPHLLLSKLTPYH